MQKKHSHPRAALALAIVLALALLAGCSAGTANSQTATAEAGPYAPAPADMATGGSYEYDMAPETAAQAYDGGTADNLADGPTLTLPQDERKIILTAHLNIETLEYDDACTRLQQAAMDAGGYVSSTSISGSEGSHSRTASFTMKVPAENYSQFLAAASAAGSLVSRDEYSDDVTDQYVDVESRLKALRTQEARLLELMEESARLTDLLEVQNQLTQVQYEIESYMGQKRSLDSLTAYSTVHITVYEVQRITEPEQEGYGSRVGKTFRDSWRAAGEFFQELGLVLVSLLPLLIFLAVVAAIVILLVRRHIKKRAATQKPPAAISPQPTSPQQTPGGDTNGEPPSAPDA